MADSPLIESFGAIREPRIMPPSVLSAVDMAPTIAGQLIIYDLDEEPPVAGQMRGKNGELIIMFLCILRELR